MLRFYIIAALVIAFAAAGVVGEIIVFNCLVHIG
jgi:hypothetical protein